MTAPTIAGGRGARWRLSGAAVPVLVAPLVVLVVGLSLWQGGVFHAIFGLKTFTVPYPAAIVEGWEANGDLIREAILASLPAALIGYATGMTFGLTIASLLVWFKPVLIDRLLPFLSATNSLPIVALAPLVALFTGPGLPLKVIVVAVMTTPVMVEAHAMRREQVPGGARLIDAKTVQRHGCRR